MDLNALGNALVIGASIGVASYTISRTYVFKAVRKEIAQRSEWLGMLIRCHYCVSHWISFLATIIFRPRIVHVFYPLDLIVSAFFMVMVAMLSIIVIRRASEGLIQIDADDIEALDEERSGANDVTQETSVGDQADAVTTGIQSFDDDRLDKAIDTIKDIKSGVAKPKQEKL